MIDYATFYAGQAVMGFVIVGLVLLVYPVGVLKAGVFRVLFWGLLIVNALAPYLVRVGPGDQTLLLLSSGRQLHVISFILLFACLLQQVPLRQTIPWFFWYVYALAFARLFEIFLIDVLFSRDYVFVGPVSQYLAERWDIRDLNFTAPINYLIKFIFLTLFFRGANKNPIVKRVYQYLLYGLVLVEVIQVIFFHSYQRYDSLSSTLKNSLIIGSAGLLLYRIYNHPAVSIPLGRNTYFWVCIGLLLPALSELFLELVFSVLYRTDRSQFYSLYLFRNSSQFVGYVLLMVGVWQARFLKFLPSAY